MDKIVVLKPEGPNSGIFAFLWQTLRGIYHYPNKKYYILFDKYSCYYDNNYSIKNNISNIWDYFFEQPHIDKLPPNEYIESVVGRLFNEESEFRDIYTTLEKYNERRIKFNEIIGDYFKLLPHVQKKIDDFYNKNLNGKNVLGIHCRGTDHPDKLNVKNVVNMSDEYIKKYDSVFITSDQQDYINEFKKIYGDKIITYNVTGRGIGDTPLHYNNSFNIPKYNIGEDALVEAYLLSKTNFLLCTVNSNVNYYIRAINKNINFKILKKYDTN